MAAMRSYQEILLLDPGTSGRGKKGREPSIAKSKNIGNLNPGICHCKQHIALEQKGGSYWKKKTKMITSWISVQITLYQTSFSINTRRRK
jgi:hypothetical protein